MASLALVGDIEIVEESQERASIARHVTGDANRREDEGLRSGGASW